MNKRFVAARAEPVKAQISTIDVERAFYHEYATSESGKMWWWCRLVLLDPDELIVDDGQDNIYRLPFTVDGLSVGFGEPTEVRIEFVDASVRSEAVAAACRGIAAVRGDQKVAASYSTREESLPQEGGSVDLAQLRKILNLSADTPDDEVLKQAAVKLGATAPGSEPVAEKPKDGDDPEAERAERAGLGGPASTTEQPVSAPGSEVSVVSVDKAQFEQLQRDAAQGVEARREQLDAADEAEIQAAIDVGKFPPSRKAHWLTLLKNDREGTRATIATLMENVVPVKERGVSPEGHENATTAVIGYPQEWLPDIAARKAALAAGNQGRVFTDGAALPQKVA